MWLTLPPGAKSGLELTHRQSTGALLPSSAPRMIVVTRSRLTEAVLVASPRLVRLRYELNDTQVSRGVAGEVTRPWPEAARLDGAAFEIMVTERSVLVAPTGGPTLPEPFAGFVNTMAEDVRSSWCLPPEHADTGATWQLSPAVPATVPNRVAPTAFDVRCRLVARQGTAVTVQAVFRVRLTVPGVGRRQRGGGAGEMTAVLDPVRGVLSATRASRITIDGTEGARELLESALELHRQ